VLLSVSIYSYYQRKTSQNADIKQYFLMFLHFSRFNINSSHVVDPVKIMPQIQPTKLIPQMNATKKGSALDTPRFWKRFEIDFEV
jgi:hypothetical protein